MLFALGLAAAPAQQKRDVPIPHLEKRGSATQLIVDGKPMLLLAGELGNNTSSSLEYMQAVWPRLAKMNLNAVLAPVAWDWIEPEENKFDFKVVDGLILEARRRNLRVVFLWFGAWKDLISCYVPIWVKKDQARFPRVPDKSGRSMEVLSVLDQATLNADTKAYRALLRHLREVDGQTRTVIMMQVLNEVGFLGDSRERSPAANQAFAAAVPAQLMNYLQKHRDTLVPEFRKVWETEGFRTSGTWEEVFGKGPATDDIFMAWFFARYTGTLASAGKAEYALPTFVDAGLIDPRRPGPGQYPSGGPLPHLFDLWRAAAPAVDIYSPDIWSGGFADWCTRYVWAGNPLFIPEIRGDATTAANVFYAVGQHKALGFSPFGVETLQAQVAEQLTRSYELLSQMAGLILESQAKGSIAGVMLDPQNSASKITLGDYTLDVSYARGRGGPPAPSASPTGPAPAQPVDYASGLILATAPDEYVVAGRGLSIVFSSVAPGAPLVGLARVVEGSYAGGRWTPGRMLSGDDTGHGRNIRLPFGDRYTVLRVQLYRYR
jgi:hypothetical protein